MNFPAPVQKTKMFQSLAKFNTSGETWTRVADESEKSIEDQFNEWVEAEQPSIVAATAAPVNVFRTDPDTALFIYVKYVYYTPSYADNNQSARQEDA